MMVYEAKNTSREANGKNSMHLREMLKVTTGMNKHSAKNSVKKSQPPPSTHFFVPNKKNRSLQKIRDNKFFFPDTFPVVPVHPTTTHPLLANDEEAEAWLLTSKLLDSMEDATSARTTATEGSIVVVVDDASDDDGILFSPTTLF
jgi:hypothetical protein